MRIEGHWVPQGLRSAPVSTRRVLLAGDAAATADPLFGEGISYAIVSAELAVETVTDMNRGAISDLRPYDDRLRQLLGPVIRRLGFAAAAAELSMTLALMAVRLSPWVRTYAVDVIGGRKPPFTIDVRPDVPSLARVVPPESLVHRSASTLTASPR